MVIDGPTQLRGAEVDAHGDHRLAMALIVGSGLRSRTRRTRSRASFLMLARSKRWNLDLNRKGPARPTSRGHFPPTARALP
jgi:hypothetical protein